MIRWVRLFAPIHLVVLWEWISSVRAFMLSCRCVRRGNVDVPVGCKWEREYWHLSGMNVSGILMVFLYLWTAPTALIEDKVIVITKTVQGVEQ